MLKANTQAYEPVIAGKTPDSVIKQDKVQELNPRNDQDKVAQFLQHMPDVVCWSHLRWDFVYQRPQHLLSRFAKYGRVFFIEEPVHTDTPDAYLQVKTNADKVQVVLPHLPHHLTVEQTEETLQALLKPFFVEHNLERYLFWYYTPMALGFTAGFNPILTIYDCMDELAAFKFAPPRLQELEAQLFQKADLVFTGGHTLYEAKKQQHPHVYPFPSSIDKAHFEQAKQAQSSPPDQEHIPHPRVGFFGVIDERLDIDLLGAIAAARPAWQLVLIGPVVKIDPATLPQQPNIHYLGGKSYQELPAYLSGWDVAILPFAINASTKFISQTKTPEYLAAGKPVVSTPIRDVVRPYGDEKLVHIAGTPEEFVTAIEQALEQQQDDVWKAKVDAFLAGISWDKTWRQMVEVAEKARSKKVKAKETN